MLVQHGDGGKGYGGGSAIRAGSRFLRPQGSGGGRRAGRERVVFLFPLSRSLPAGTVPAGAGDAHRQHFATDHAVPDAGVGGYGRPGRGSGVHHVDIDCTTGDFRGAAVGGLHPELDPAACEHAHQHRADFGFPRETDAAAAPFLRLENGGGHYAAHRRPWPHRVVHDRLVHLDALLVRELHRVRVRTGLL